MRTVLCFGDSNTWGFDAATGGRLGRWQRWPGVLQRELGDETHVVEAGLNSRTTVFDLEGYSSSRSGLSALPQTLETHAPVDVAVVFLGTNDLFVPGVDVQAVAGGMRAVVESALRSPWGPDDGPPRVLAISPPPFGRLRDDWARECPSCVEASRHLGRAFASTLAGLPCDLLDLTGVATPTPLDGIHFDADQHDRIGLAVAGRLSER